MHNPESLLDNETHKLLWNFEIQTDHLIMTITSDCQQKREPAGFAVPANHRIKLKESEKSGKYLDLVWELKKHGT